MVRGLQWQTIQLSLAGGVETKEDVRAADPRQMDIARDMQFDELKGAQTRKPITPMSNAIFGGGTLANCRQVTTVNGELVVMTNDTLYSYNAQQAAWVARGAHLAVATAETPAFATSGDQIDGDRAELNGTIVYAWTEGTTVFAEAIDKTTGSVLVSPRAVSTAVGRPRLVALATKILLFTDAGASNLTVRAIDPAAPAVAIGGAGTTVLAGNFNLFYDVVRAGSQDLCIGACRRTTTTSFTAFSVSAALAVSATTKAREADGPLAVAVDPLGTNAQLVRTVVSGSTSLVRGDLIVVSTLADVLADVALGTVAFTTLNQIAIEYSSVKVGGQYVATAVWSSQETTTASAFRAVANTVDQAGAVGTPVLMPQWLGIASRAFERGGAIYLWLVFAGSSAVSGTGTSLNGSLQLQNTYLLYRSDGFLVTKSVFAAGAGFSSSTGHLPGVALTSGTSVYSWAGARRRIIPLGGGFHGFAQRVTTDITFTFDSDAARRAASIGRTLYITGGMPLQYDGVALVEQGFLVYPWQFSTNTAAGAIAIGTYAYKATWRWTNAQAEQERSTTATDADLVLSGASKVTLTNGALTVTRKTGLVPPPAVEFWRTAIAPSDDAPFYLVTSKDPLAVGDNGYVANDATLATNAAFNDNFTDAVLTTKETNPENGTVLEALAPPAASIIFATADRLYLAGIAGQPDAVWYSRLRDQGEIASWNDALVALIPPQGGPITALAFLNETLVVFRSTAIYALPGVGFDNGGGGQNYGPANRLAADVGAVSAESVALTPKGLVFKSRKGWYLLDRSWNPQYIGGPVTIFDGDTVLAVTVVETQHQVRIVTNARMIVWDYYNAIETPAGDWAQWGSWAEWTIADGLGATMWAGSYVYLTATGPKIEQATFATGVTYGMDLETSWIKLADLQGNGKVRWLEVLGEWRSAFLARIRVARDYQYDGAGNVVYFDDKTWTPTPTVAGSALQVRHSVTQQNCEAIKVRITAVNINDTKATLVTSTDGPTVATSGANWSTTFVALPPMLGVMGNAITMSLGFTAAPAGTSFVIDVRDHYSYDPVVGRWHEDIDNIGVRVICRTGSSPTVQALSAAINAGSQLAQVQAVDPIPTNVVNAAFMIGQLVAAQFSRGAFTAPNGESCKLTGLGLEVGIKPGLYRRLPAGQQQ